MLLDIRKLFRPDAKPVKETLSFDFSQEDFPGYEVPEPVVMRYEAKPYESFVRFSLTITATLNASCSRCLEPASVELPVEKQYDICPEDVEEEVPQLPFTRQKLLDLRELAYGEIVIEAPASILCTEDCDGLCDVCGCKASECHCVLEEEGDPRLQVLKELLNDT